MDRYALQSTLRSFVASCIALLLASVAQAQILNVTNSTSTPIPGAGHDYVKMLSETVNPANGSVSVRVGIPTPSGRLVSLPFAFAYDSNGAQHVTSSGTGNISWTDNVFYLAKGGWSYTVPTVSTIRVREPTPGYGGPATRCTYYDDYVFQDENGGRHSLYLSVVPSPQPSCNFAQPIIPMQQLTGGEDYFSAALTSNTAPLLIADADGTVYTFPGSGQLHLAPNNGASSSSLPSTIEDRNGNVITVTDNGAHGGALGSFTVTDTLGRTLLSSSGFGTTGNTINASGLSVPYTLTWGTAPTNFSVGSVLVQNSSNGCGAFGADVNSLNVVTNITLPNNQSYSFSYDSRYGLLQKITYPTGGYVSYSWGLNSLSEFASFEDLSSIPNGCLYHYDGVAIAHRYVSFDGVHVALQQDFTYSTNWSGNITSWGTKTTTVKTTDLITGALSTTVYNYSPYTPPSQPNDEVQFDPQIPLETSINYQNSSGTTLRTVNKTWLDQYELIEDCII